MGSCVTARRVNYLQEPNNHIPAYQDTILTDEYAVRRGDRIFIRVYSTDEATNAYFNGGLQGYAMQQLSSDYYQSRSASSDLYTYLVLADGTITFPMLGDVMVEGLTLREMKRKLERELAQVASGVSLELKVVNRFFSVIGDGRSGQYSMSKEQMSIFEALAMAGDLGDFEDRGKVRIIRETEEGTVVKMFDLRSKDILNSEYYYIQPNDVIYIQTLSDRVFGVNSLGTLISVIASTVSFGVFIYSFIDRYIVQPLKPAP